MNTAELARSTVAETEVAVGVASGAFAAANTKRQALYFPSSKTVDLTYSTLGTAVLYEGINIFAGGAGVWLDFGTHGPAVTSAWNVIASAALALTVSKIEVLRAE